MSKKLTTRSEDYSKWYNELVTKADLAENSAVRGCMVIKPYGYAIWEKMQAELDKKFKETGHQNAYFPLLVPKSLFEAEEKNAEGFAKECAVVTHYRLKNNPDESAINEITQAISLLNDMKYLKKAKDQAKKLSLLNPSDEDYQKGQDLLEAYVENITEDVIRSGFKSSIEIAES